MIDAATAGFACLVVWCATWLPGLAFFSRRARTLFTRSARLRAAAEGLLLGAVPALAFNAYQWLSGSAPQLLSRGSQPAWRIFGLPALETMAPYAVAYVAFWWSRSRPASTPVTGLFWGPTLVAFASVPLLSPGMLLGQLMFLVGG